MPDFNTTLLLLMGISAGTYLGFKANENNVQPTPGANNFTRRGITDVTDSLPDFCQIFEVVLPLRAA